MVGFICKNFHSQTLILFLQLSQLGRARSSLCMRGSQGENSAVLYRTDFHYHRNEITGWDSPRAHTQSGNSLSILPAEAGILVSLASELFLELGHLGKLSKYTGPLNLGCIHQGHKKQTIQPSPPSGADRSVVDVEAEESFRRSHGRKLGMGRQTALPTLEGSSRPGGGPGLCWALTADTVCFPSERDTGAACPHRLCLLHV